MYMSSLSYIISQETIGLGKKEVGYIGNNKYYLISFTIKYNFYFFYRI